MIKQWYNEAVNSGVHVYSADKVDFIIYKGFRISADCSIQDVRKNDFYTDVTEDDFETFKKYGFVRGADNIAYERNSRRLEKYTVSLEKLYTEKDGLIKNSLTTEKELENCVNACYKYADLFFFYKAKMLQHEQKYKLI